MDRDKQETLFRRALALCRKGQLMDAADAFQLLLESGTEEPVHLSYCGLLTATARGDRRAGLALCQRAFNYGTNEPAVVINLARVYQSVGSRIKAIAVLRRGLRQTPGHPDMVALIDQLSPRAKPPLSVVDRDNPLNKSMAIALAKVRGRLHRSEDDPEAQPA